MIQIILISGFCRNDKNHEVYLLVEAFTNSDSTTSRAKKVGEGKFPIYPRPNAPRLNRYAEPGEDYYNYTDIMSLLRTHSTDNIQMHCGRIRSTYSLHEVIIKPPTPPVRTPPSLQVPQSDRRPTPSPRLTPRPTPRLTTADTQPPPSTMMTQRKPPTPESTWDDENISFTAPPSPPLPPASDGKRVSWSL